MFILQFFLYIYKVHYESNAHDFIVTRISIAVW